MIPRYTRPELAAIWSDDARFEAMREVEVAACEELDGPTVVGSGFVDDPHAAHAAAIAVAAMSAATGR